MTDEILKKEFEHYGKVKSARSCHFFILFANNVLLFVSIRLWSCGIKLASRGATVLSSMKRNETFKERLIEWMEHA